MSSPFGPYRIVRELGQGGMGTVYEVAHEEIPRRLALKLINELVADEEALLRFEREAHLLARARHRNVVRIHELGRSPKGPFLVTDLIEGKTLRELSTGHPLAPREAARIVRELADALVTLHGFGILHRDLKPENVILQPDGTPVLLDFGLARLVDGQRLTRTGQVMGTPTYMAPEQCQGISDERTDIYGLGAILYALLAGHSPFEAASHLKVMTLVMTQDPRWPSEERPGLPPDLEAILRVAMTKDPARRHPTVRDLRDDLDRFLRGQPVWAVERFPALLRERKLARLRGLALAISAPLVIVIASVMVAASMRARAPLPPTVAPAAPPAAPPVAPPAAPAAADRERPRLQVVTPPPPVVCTPQLRLSVRADDDQAPRVTLRVISSTGERDLSSIRTGVVEEVALDLRPGEVNDLALVARDESGKRSDAVDVRTRAWHTGEPERLAPFPLPAGVRLGEAEGEYRLGDHVLVWIPPGPTSAGPVEGLFMGKHEVTRGELRAFRRARGDESPPPEPADEAPSLPRLGEEGEAHAAIMVGYVEAQDFCAALGGRLPTEAEWERAARGDTTRRFPWGDEPPDGTRGNFFGTRGADRWPTTSPGGQFPLGASRYGCLDMAGNAAEWTLAPPGAQERALRGGPWFRPTGMAPTEASLSLYEVARREPVPVVGVTEPFFGAGFRVALPHRKP